MTKEISLAVYHAWCWWVTLTSTRLVKFTCCSAFDTWQRAQVQQQDRVQQRDAHNGTTRSRLACPRESGPHSLKRKCFPFRTGGEVWKIVFGHRSDSLRREKCLILLGSLLVRLVLGKPCDYSVSPSFWTRANCRKIAFDSNLLSIMWMGVGCVATDPNKLFFMTPSVVNFYYTLIILNLL